MLKWLNSLFCVRFFGLKWIWMKKKVLCRWQSNFRVSVEHILKLIWPCCTSLCDWSKKNSRHPSNHSDAKLKPSTPWSPAFSCAWGSLHFFTLSSDWSLSIIPFALIGWYDNHGFALRSTSNVTTSWDKRKKFSFYCYSPRWITTTFLPNGFAFMVLNWNTL